MFSLHFIPTCIDKDGLFHLYTYGEKKKAHGLILSFDKNKLYI